MGGVCQKRPEVINLEKDDIKDKRDSLSSQNISNDNIDNEKRKNFGFFGKKFEQINLSDKKEINKLHQNTDKNSQSKKPKRFTEFMKGQCIGEGYHSSVYFGLSVNTGEILAIQKINLSKFEEKKLNVENEFSKIKDAVYGYSLLNHNNIIKYFGTQQSDDDNKIEILLEFCNGGSIKQLLNKFNAFDEKLIKLYTKQILEGLAYLHDKNIIHRNLKNTNILVDGNGVVKISDLIISNVLIGNNKNSIIEYYTKNGEESPYYIAPELINREYKISTCLDIWNLGCLIIEMATNLPPWSNLAKSYKEVIDLIANSSIPPKFPSHVSKECKSFLTCCLQKNPSNRWTARKLLEHPFFKNNNTKESNDKNEKKEINSDKKSTLSRKLVIETDKNENKENKNSINTDLIYKSFMSEEICEENQIKYNNGTCRNLENYTNNTNQATNNTNSNQNKLDFFLSNKSNKITNKHIVIKEKEERKQNMEILANKNIVNILNDNSQHEKDALFSVTMTLYTEQSEMPQTLDFMNKTNLLFDKIEGKSDDKQLFKFSKLNTKKIEEVIQESENDNKIKLIDNSDIELDNSIRNIFENYNLSFVDFNNKENLEKLGTLHLNDHEAKKLENFFKNKFSIII